MKEEGNSWLATDNKASASSVVFNNNPYFEITWIGECKSK